MTRMKRWALIALAVAALLALAAAIGLHFAARALKQQIQQALGPEAEVGALEVGFSSVELEDLRVKGPPGWPAPETLRAQRVLIVPRLASLLSERVRINRIRIEGGYVSALRARDGRLRVLPGLTEARHKPTDRSGAAAPPVSIGTIELVGGVLELFDASVRQPPHKVRLERLNATIEHLQVPELSGRTSLALDGVVKGVQRDGTLSIKGWSELVSKDSEIATVLRGVDLVALQPYLIKAAETSVRHGSMDLDLKSSVRKNVLHAPGKLTLTGLELGSGGSFMGVPRQAVVSALKDRSGRITVQFTLEGNINDPRFSLNESFTRHVGSALAEGLGISVKGLATSVGEAARGAGDTLRKALGR